MTQQRVSFLRILSFRPANAQGFIHRVRVACSAMPVILALRTMCVDQPATGLVISSVSLARPVNSRLSKDSHHATHGQLALLALHTRPRLRLLHQTSSVPLLREHALQISTNRRHQRLQATVFAPQCHFAALVHSRLLAQRLHLIVFAHHVQLVMLATMLRLAHATGLLTLYASPAALAACSSINSALAPLSQTAFVSTSPLAPSVMLRS